MSCLHSFSGIHIANCKELTFIIYNTVERFLIPFTNQATPPLQMKTLVVAALLVFRVGICFDWSETAKQAIDAQKAENVALRNELTRLGRQLMLQQFFTEERIRSEGSSGKH